MNNYFKELGFKGPIQEADHTRYWYRKVPDTNHHQIIVREWDMHKLGLWSYGSSYEVEMTYETADGIWANTKYYGLNEVDLKANLSKLEERLSRSVVSMGGNPDHYRTDGED